MTTALSDSITANIPISKGASPNVTPDELPIPWHGASPAWRLIDLPELWRFRELIWAFGFRDSKDRYRQTAVGIAWTVIQPLMTVIVFGILIHWLRGSASDEVGPVKIFVLGYQIERIEP